MDADEVERAKHVLRSSPTRPFYPGDGEIVIRCTDLGASDRQLLERFAALVGVRGVRAGVSAIRPSESFPLIGDTEYRFPVQVLTSPIAP